MKSGLFTKQLFGICYTFNSWQGHLSLLRYEAKTYNPYKMVTVNKAYSILPLSFSSRDM